MVWNCLYQTKEVDYEIDLHPGSYLPDDWRSNVAPGPIQGGGKGMSEKEETAIKIVQAVAAAITFSTAAWSHSISVGRLPTQDEFEDIVAIAVLPAAETILSICDELRARGDELLEACKVALEHMHHKFSCVTVGDGTSFNNCNCEIKMVEAAITHAEGGE